MKVENGKTYIGVVEDNEDPKKLGRVKVRVLDVFDNTPIDDIPWSNPWKDLCGDEFCVPDKGKVVTVIFENANINSPEFIFSDHYNINLEKKLESLNGDNYTSMKSLIFDHKTQIYVNDDEGLKIDYKFNVINIKEKTIDINLKDNFGKINLGSANSNQRSILGDNFLDWFDSFVNILLGSEGGPYLGNSGAPIVATPALLANLQKYKSLKDPKFLSKNVYIVDNEDVEKLDRVAEGQKGDKWESTVRQNKDTSKEPIGYKSIEGPTNTSFDQPSVNSDINAEDIKYSPINIPDVDVIIDLLKEKEYKLYDDVSKLNIIGVRCQCQKIGDKYTDQFVDKLYIMFKNIDGTWFIKNYIFSTVPGVEFTISKQWLEDHNLKDKVELIDSQIKMKDYVRLYMDYNQNIKNGLPILSTSQYIDTYYIDKYRGELALLPSEGSTQLVWRDIDSYNYDTFNPTNYQTPELIIVNKDLDNGIKIQRGYPGGKRVGSWSEGSQVFSSSSDLNDFFKYCNIHKDLYGNSFTYTLVTKSDWDIVYQKLISKN